MTDLETMIEMMTRAGVKFKEIPAVRPNGVLLDVEEEPGSETNLGYCGFFSRLYFTADGRLRAIGAWE